MAPVDKEMQEEIKKGVTLAKVDTAELQQREEEKRKRMEELEKVKAALGQKE
ncbi:MAG: hypothetical protein ACW96X_05665 [Promethearchaeota archaeon]